MLSRALAATIIPQMDGAFRSIRPFLPRSVVKFRLWGTRLKKFLLSNILFYAIFKTAFRNIVMNGGAYIAKQIEGVYERVLACAKEEFLARGFAEASLRTIAKNAGTSTGSIYTRFGDKEGLFHQIVSPVSEEMKRMFLEIQEEFHHFDEGTQRERIGTYTSREQERMVDFMYDHLDEFRLLLDAAYGTQFQHFTDEMVRIEADYTYKYMEVIHCDSVRSGAVTEEFIHMVITAYFNGMFEVVRHYMDRDSAKRHIRMLNRYHMAGFGTVFAPEP